MLAPVSFVMCPPVSESLPFSGTEDALGLPSACTAPDPAVGCSSRSPSPLQETRTLLRVGVPITVGVLPLGQRQAASIPDVHSAHVHLRLCLVL